ncbi:MAG: HAD family phosphatase [Clostridia bacterium]|nr:HAD family phosphatase [Clostridia bacterium]
MIKLIASDVDGTIIDKNNKIPKENLEAIDKIHEKNIPFAICTGKTYAVSENICKQFNPTFGIFGNGTQIIDFKNNKELLRNTLSKEDLLYITTLVERFDLHLHIYTDKEIISEKLKYMDLRNFILKSKNSSIDLNFKIVGNITDYISKNDLSVFSAVVSSENSLFEFEQFINVNNNIMYQFINKRGKYKDIIIEKEYEYINISPTHIDKDESVNFLTNYLKIKKQEVLAIGDNVNDLNMVKNSGIGVAVNEAYDELKQVANYVTTKTTAEGAFSEAINKFIK